ncbi:MAG: efflux RND transporter periplasmic adaptor subunit, partial [Desulfofustis sp.]|nr:efflux RND transporter periplasmic adaptor subunit [Desulfofustis sp.]
MRYLLLLILSLWILTAGAVLAADGPKKGEVDPKTGKIIKYWVAPMDPKYIRDEPGKSPMGMDLVPVYEEEAGEKLPTSTIRIDPVTMQNMGVRMAPVRRKPLTQSIRALGTVTYDETRVQVVNLKFDGWIEELFVNSVGESVKKGQPLFRIYSPELVTAQEEYLLAVRQGKSLGNSPHPSIRKNADSLQAAARQRLLYWDLEPVLVEQLTTSGEPVKAITVYSPAPGVVTKKQVLNGQFIKAGMNQYEIADLSHVWVDVEVYEYELPYVHPGMTVAMDLSYLPGRKIKGEVLFIYPYLDSKTRTVRLRLAFDNQEGLLKPGMYGNVFLESVIDANALVIPYEAVIDSGLRKVVFVSRGQGKFELRDVKLGIEGNDGTYQVLDGLHEGENIVISAQFMFDSESRLREAIQKMLEVRNGGDGKTEALSTDDLN